MTIFVSSLIRGMNEMEKLVEWIDAKQDPNLGVELIAFTHDSDYWNRLEAVLDKISCPVSFHGPYIGVEATALSDSKEQEWLFQSYEKVMKLANRHGVEHIVFHYTQKGFQAAEKAFYQKTSQANIKVLLEMAKQYHINLLIENLPFPKDAESLYSLQEYEELFDQYQEALSIIDIGHAHMNGMDVEQFLAKHAQRVKAYHFHNNDGKADQHNTIDDGTFSFSDFSEVYKRYTPTASIVLEYEPHTKLSETDLQKQINNVSKMFNQ